ncbi:HNH endonuclease [Mycobacterium bohemicum DSM 44277]|uniref:HNH endonuclease n=1 Tax=Mycobacterium bohemicum DSM 44277 TaxID=1236609 RepID=A0A0U0WEI3_MYCBE|nr:HNH endonuclease signature motif containing protein [Mycobacterium bohemicum]CPR13491.1 HNH endonuclease [Mycobacterium bohemicum DSM 44277]
MFDMSLPDPAQLRGAPDDAVVAAIRHCARAEAAAAGRRLAAIAELVARHADGPTDSAHWSCDNWDAMAAEVAAALGISHTLASGQMYQAVALRHRLPRVGALLAEGAISARLAGAIVWHTDLIKDPDILARVDAALAADAARFGPLTVTKTAQAIDAIVDRHDPAAVRRTRIGARNREVVIAQGDGESGTAALWGRLLANDAAVLDRRLTQMAHQVCDDDPRTLAQRRADALGTLAAGGEELACDRPAECADIDHTVPYPFGPTHPSNLKCLCRKHHLLKTFWTGWRDKQWPDGTIVWTSPTGQTYTTRPGSRLLFPSLCVPTGELPTGATSLPASGQRGIMMPTRRRTRVQDRSRRIDAERALNRVRRDRKALAPDYFGTAPHDGDDDPPPF